MNSFMLAHSAEVMVSVRLCIAFLCGAIIGIQRKRVKADDIAIYRVHVLLCVGAALVAATSEVLSATYSIDVTRLSAQVISGISFVGVGVIVKHDNDISGLTTAATIWASGAIGIAIGFGRYILGIVGTLLILILLITGRDRDKVNKFTQKKDASD